MTSWQESAEQCIDTITRKLAAGEISKCEAFAQAMECLARIPIPGPVSTPTPVPPGSSDGASNVVPTQPLAASPIDFLNLAWGYLVDTSDQDHSGSVPGIGEIVVSKSRRRESYQPPAWTNTHVDGGIGSGWMPPLSGDPSPAEANSGHSAHFLANAILRSRYGMASDVYRALFNSEASTTDTKINSLGSDFAQFLGNGSRTPEEIGDWIRKNMCTETGVLTLNYKDFEMKAYPCGELASYYNVRFKLYRPGTGEQIDEWTAWVKLAGGHTQYGCLGSHEVWYNAKGDVSLAKADLRKLAEETMNANSMEIVGGPPSCE